MTILPGYANSVGVSPELIGLLFTFFGIARVMSFAMSDQYSRFHENEILGIASMLLALGSVIIAISPSFAGFTAALVIIGTAVGAIFPMTISLISKHFPSDRIGTGMGSYESTVGAGLAVGPLLAGIIVALTSPLTTFLMTALFGVLMTILIKVGHPSVHSSSKS